MILYVTLGGWGGGSSTMLAVWGHAYYHTPICRIERLEFLDEQELLFQLLQHYTLSCGYSDHAGIGKHQDIVLYYRIYKHYIAIYVLYSHVIRDAHLLVYCCLATKVFVDKLPAAGWVWVITE